MPGQGIVFVSAILTVCSLGAVVGFFISTGRALKKFDCLDSEVQEKLLLLEYYMAAVRNFSKEDLIRLSKLPDKEIRCFNTIHDYDERLRAIREKLGK
ncbi:MAG: hypothetical protein LBK63_14515 [Treponema sp.]|jgi:hypothetical protein|nr:hypothetical protein [Treponema sp.]